MVRSNPDPLATLVVVNFESWGGALSTVSSVAIDPIATGREVKKALVNTSSLCSSTLHFYTVHV